MTPVGLWLAIIAACLMSCRPAVVPAAFADLSDYSPVGGVTQYPFEPVRKILTASCTQCHGPALHEGRVDLSSYKKVMKQVVKGHPEKSLLYLVLGVGVMPPHYYARIPKEDIETIKNWISFGAKQR